MSIKPVGITFERLLGGIDVDWFEAMPDGRYLYAIPDTHRVVPVEVLQATMTGAYPFELKLCEKIRAIIEDKP